MIAYTTRPHATGSIRTLRRSSPSLLPGGKPAGPPARRLRAKKKSGITHVRTTTSPTEWTAPSNAHYVSIKFDFLIKIKAKLGRLHAHRPARR